ncbi:hypothetical protein [Pseudoalteromonas phage J2-1_QLiu-2017]|nr:hypothetical protein [Pseudoalteromonas phage J2-1_QLiu-2017]
MTCIVAIKEENGTVWMGGDLLGSNGFTKRQYPTSKVFRNGDFLIGFTSSFRMGQILEHNWTPPPMVVGQPVEEYFRLDVIESIRATFEHFGYGTRDGLEDIGGNFLIAYQGRLFEMQCNYSVLEIEDFVSVGSGQYHAEGCLYATLGSDMHPVARIEQAIEAAAEFTTSVSADCTVLCSDPEWDEDEYDRQIHEAEMEKQKQRLLSAGLSQEEVDLFVELNSRVAIFNHTGTPVEKEENLETVSEEQVDKNIEEITQKAMDTLQEEGFVVTEDNTGKDLFYDSMDFQTKNGKLSVYVNKEDERNVVFELCMDDVTIIDGYMLPKEAVLVHILPENVFLQETTEGDISIPSQVGEKIFCKELLREDFSEVQKDLDNLVSIIKNQNESVH